MCPSNLIWDMETEECICPPELPCFNGKACTHESACKPRKSDCPLDAPLKIKGKCQPCPIGTSWNRI